MNIEDELNKITELTKELERSTNEHLKMACDGISGIENEEIKNYMRDSLTKAKNEMACDGISGIENEEIKNYMRDSLTKAKNGTLDVITFASKVKELIKT